MLKIPKELDIPSAEAILANVEHLERLESKMAEPLESFFGDGTFPECEFLHLSEVAEMWDCVISNLVVAYVKQNLLRFRETKFGQFPFPRCSTPFQVILLAAEYGKLYAWRVQSIDSTSSPPQVTPFPHLGGLCPLSQLKITEIECRCGQWD